MKNEIKEECKKLWAKVKPYLPLIGVIGLVCSMILGLVCFWRCSEEDNIVQANADEILSQYDTYYNGDYVYDSLKTQFAYSVPCNLFRYETSPNLIDKTASLETTVIYGYLQTLSYSKSVNNANTYYQMFNICNNTHCALDYADYIRRRINTVFNLMHFKKWFGIVYTVRVRNISISEEIKTIEEEDTEDNMTLLWGFMGFFKHYDTYCYSERYNTVPEWREREYFRMKKNELLAVPEKRVKKKTNDKEPLS